jgi:hypothetical protein
MPYTYSELEAGYIPGHPLAFQKNAVGKIQLYSFVFKAFDWVGNAISDLADWAVDEIIRPVTRTVGDVLEGMLDNPIKTIAQIAILAGNPANYWMLSLVEGADVAVKGGDLEDVAKAVAVSFVSQQIAAPIAKETSALAARAGANAATAAVLGHATASSAVAIVRGQDPVEAFIRGGVTAAVPAILGKVDAFSELPQVAQDVLAAGISAKLTGQDVNIGMINAAVASIDIGSKILNEFDPADPATGKRSLTTEQTALAASVINRVTATAFTGGNPSAAVQQALMNAGTQALSKAFDKKVEQIIKEDDEEIKIQSDVKGVLRGLDEAYNFSQESGSIIQETYDRIEALTDNYNIAARNINNITKVLEEQRRYIEGEREKYFQMAARNDPGLQQATYDSMQAGIARYNALVANANDPNFTQNGLPANLPYYYNVMEQINEDIEYYSEEIGFWAEMYDLSVSEVQAASELLGEWTELAFQDTAQSFVEVMDPKFNADQYREINKLGEDVDVYEHWLSEGQYEGLKTNKEAVEADITLEKLRLIEDISKENNLSLSNISEEDAKRISNLVDETYGLDIDRLKTATAGTFSEDTQLQISEFITNVRTDKEALEAKTYGDWNKPTDTNVVVPEGLKLATADEVASNKAVKVIANDGVSMWISPGSIEGWDATVGDRTALRIEINGVGDPSAGTTPTVVVTATRPPPTLEDLFETDVLSWMTTTQELPPESLTTIDKTLLDITKGGVELAKDAGASEGTLTLIGNVLKASGLVAQSFGGLVAAIGQNPNDSRLYRLGKDLVALGTATTSEEYQAAIKNINESVGNAVGGVDTFFAIIKSGWDYPVEFASEYIGVQAGSALTSLLVGGGATKAAEGLLIARGMGQKLAERAANNIGVNVAIATGVLESAGGSAANAFEETYAVARQQGLSEEAATKAALEVASKTAAIAAITTLGASKLGGAALEKFMLGDKALGTADALKPYEKIQDFITTGGLITIKEGVTNGGEEGVIQSYLEGQLYQLDPTRDIAGNITAATTFGGIGGAGVSGGIYAGSQGINLVTSGMQLNPQVQNVLSQDWATPGEMALALSNLTGGVNVEIDPTKITQQEGATNAQILEDIQKQTPTDGESLGIGLTVSELLKQKFGDQVLDVQDIKDLGAAQGIDVSTDAVKNLITQLYTPFNIDINAFTTATNANADFSDAFKNQLNTSIQDYVYSGKRNIFVETTNPETGAKQFETLDFVSPFRYVEDPNSATGVTLSTQPLTPEETELNKTSAQSYINYLWAAADRATKETQINNIFSELGFTPNQEQVDRFIRIGDVVDVSTLKAEIEAFVDPFVVSPEEVREQYQILGLPNPTDTDVSRFTGQNPESEIPNLLNEYLPTARFNALSQEFTEYKTEAERRAEEQAKLIGTPFRAPTTDDVTNIQNIINQQQQNPEVPLTADQLRYDTNKDNIVDSTDLNFLTQYLEQTTQGGTPQFQPPPESIWAPTGLYAQVPSGGGAAPADLTGLQDQLAAAEAARQAQARQTQAALRTSQQRQNVSQLYNFLQMEPGFGPSGGAGTGQVKAPDPAKIGYIYDWSSIFANPQQERMFISPYAEGGAVEYEVTDELLKILRG